MIKYKKSFLLTNNNELLNCILKNISKKHLLLRGILETEQVVRERGGAVVHGRGIHMWVMGEGSN